MKTVFRAYLRGIKVCFQKKLTSMSNSNFKQEVSKCFIGFYLKVSAQRVDT
ncbi:MAG: hypothetical protein ACI9QN_002222 [Arcticibacterium sp.]